jgi:L-ascorbate metabolism protein UlaG (beta-lactamase superfamily)
MTKRWVHRIAIALFGVLIISLVCLNPSAPPKALTAGVIDQYSRYFLSQSNQKPKHGSIKVTFLGTTMLLFDDGKTQLMLDGFITRLPQEALASLQTDKALVNQVLERAGVKRLKALFAAHSHFDHALDVAYIAQRTGARLFGSESTLNIGRGGDLPEDQMTLFQPGKKVPIGEFTVTVLPSKHSPPVPGINDNLGVVIDKPLRQPANFYAYAEGGSFDFLIQHGDRTILVKPAANYLAGALDNVRADVLFLATGTLGSQDQAFREAFYDQTVAKVKPQLVIPIHWDNFLVPLSESLPPLTDQDLTTSFDFLIQRLTADKIKFGIMQGYQSVMLFDRSS